MFPLLNKEGVRVRLHPHSANSTLPPWPAKFALPKGSEKERTMANVPPHEKRMELTEHLGELRSRIIRSLWYLTIGACIAYYFFQPLFGLLQKPLEKEITRLNQAQVDRQIKAQEDLERKTSGNIIILPYATHDPPTKEEFNKLVDTMNWIRKHPVAIPMMGNVFHNFHEPFMVRLTIGVLTGFILVLPLVISELAMFISPALTPQEKKPLRMLVPLSVLLMIAGVAVAYATMFYAMNWFLSYLDDFPQPSVLMQDPQDYVTFFVKMMAAFALAFQLPVILMGGAFLGFVTSKGLIKHWRWGVIVAFLGGLLTPANDPMSWILMVVPLLLLYFGSIALVKWIEVVRAKQQPA